MTRPSWLSACAGALLLAPTATTAAHPLSTEDNGTLGSGRIELEIATESTWTQGGREPAFAVLSAVHGGLHDRFDLGVGFVHPLGAQGTPALQWSDPTVDLKLRLGAPNPTAGLAIRLEWRGNFAEDGQEGHDLGAVLIGSWQTERSSIHLNLGRTWSSRGTDHAHGCWCLGGALLSEVADGWTTGIELFVEDLVGPRTRTGILNVALVRDLDRMRALSLGVGPRFDIRGFSAWFVTVGLTLSP